MRRLSLLTLRCQIVSSTLYALVEKPRTPSAVMPQESGSVNTLREAIVEIRFVGGNAFECVVDTGFDGALILPRSVVDQLKLPIVARLIFELVGGALMSADVALGEIQWLGERRIVEVIVTEGDDALIGTEVFEGATLLIDYPNRLVKISRDG